MVQSSLEFKLKPGRSKERNCFHPGRHARLKMQKYAEYPKQIISGMIVKRNNLAAFISCACEMSVKREASSGPISSKEVITGIEI